MLDELPPHRAILGPMPKLDPGFMCDLFSATPNNLSVSLGLLLANSLIPFWQAPDTLDELPMHSWRVPNRIV
ncbi:hypothetical protein B296_00047951 [Ensete ventricosum]|uniref:Uncharacterized protein n=1 Tax=Ensete ventricosum TaxID=4639 RepID=A0A426X3B0_ENSVE|nr:hypothetical protein B296_00047951 [Ensete ventricosum]